MITTPKARTAHSPFPHHSPTSNPKSPLEPHTGSSTNYWLFTGEQADQATGDTGYYFLRARYYDPTLGRFISRDPLLFDQRYVYARNNPALYVDPSGLCSKLKPWECLDDAAKAVAGAVADKVTDFGEFCFSSFDAAFDCLKRAEMLAGAGMIGATIVGLTMACVASWAGGPLVGAIVCVEVAIAVTAASVAAATVATQAVTMDQPH